MPEVIAVSTGSRLRAALQEAGDRLAGAWRSLPPARRSAMVSLVALSTLLLALLTLNRPAEAPLRLPPPSGASPYSRVAGSSQGQAAAPGPSAPGQVAQPGATRASGPGSQGAPQAATGAADGAPEPAAAPRTGDRTGAAAAEGGTPAAAADAAPAAAAADTAPLTWPVRGAVVRPYGMDRWPGTQVWHLHSGIDIAAAPGEAVVAAAAGTVVAVEDDPALGTTVILDHGGGRRTLYAGLAATGVQPRQKVARAQVIGRVGRAGPAEETGGTHLHFAVEVGGQPVDPLAHLAR